MYKNVRCLLVHWRNTCVSAASWEVPKWLLSVFGLHRWNHHHLKSFCQLVAVVWATRMTSAFLVIFSMGPEGFPFDRRGGGGGGSLDFHSFFWLAGNLCSYLPGSTFDRGLSLCSSLPSSTFDRGLSLCSSLPSSTFDRGLNRCSSLPSSTFDRGLNRCSSLPGSTFDRGFISVPVDVLESTSSLKKRPNKTVSQISKHCCILSLCIPVAKQTISPSFFPVPLSSFWLWPRSTQLNFVFAHSTTKFPS